MDEMKMIEEMAKVITDLEDCRHNMCAIECRLECACADCEYDGKGQKGICTCIEYGIADALYKARCRKIADDEQVIKTDQFYETLNSTLESGKRMGYAQGRDETAREIIAIIIDDDGADLNKIAQKYGIELEGEYENV